MKRILLPLFALAFLFVSTVHAQTLGMNLSMFDAKGEFNRNIDNDPIGLSFTYAHPINEGPINVGGELGIAMYASQEFDAVDANGIPITVYEEDCFYSLHGHLQYKIVDQPLYNIYGEGRVGFTTFFSEQHATEEGVAYENSFRFHGTAFNLGMGGGMQINLCGLFSGAPLYNDRIWIDAAISANNGTRTRYRNASEGNQSLTDANFQSYTDYTHVRIGIAARLQ